MKASICATFATFSVLLLAACEQSNPEASAPEGAPELSAVQMSLMADSTSEGLATNTDSVDPAADIANALESSAGAPSEAPDLVGARDKIHELNQSIREAFQPIVALLRNQDPSSQVGRVQMWGPVVRGATEYRFFLRHAATKRYGWRLEGRLADQKDDYSRVASGEIVVGAASRRGVGGLGIDLDTLASVDPSFQGQGKLLIGFKHGVKGSTIGYAMKNFTRNSDAYSPIDALMRAVHIEPNIRRVRLAYHANVEGTESDAKELVLARLRHVGGLGGRSDLLATAGDIPQGTAWVVSQCWTAKLESTYRVVRSCPLDGLAGENCTVVSTKGDPDACVKGLKTAELPPANPMAELDSNADADADSVRVPDELPDVSIDG